MNSFVCQAAEYGISSLVVGDPGRHRVRSYLTGKQRSPEEDDQRPALLFSRIDFQNSGA